MNVYKTRNTQVVTDVEEKYSAKCKIFINCSKKFMAVKTDMTVKGGKVMRS